MKTRLLWIYLWLMFFIVSFCLLDSCRFTPSKATASTNNKPNNSYDLSRIKNLSNSNNIFAIKLYKKLSKNDKNIFFSPFSIYDALCMSYIAARGNTKIEMKKVLSLNISQKQLPILSKELLDSIQSNSKKGYILKIANAIWIQKDFCILPSFVKTLEDYYNSQIFKVDFIKHKEITIKKINSWVAKKTNNKIKSLIHKDDIDNLTRLILTNAIYFKGDWASKFNKKETTTQKFYINNKRTINIKMMHQTGNFKYLSTKNFQVIELPYIGQTVSMVIFLPNKLTGIKNLDKYLTLKNFYLYLSELRTKNINIYLPKFKLKTRYYLKSILCQLGMKDAFSNKADFSGITGKPNLKIKKVIHQAYIKVDEKGSEAAAATAVVFKLKCIMMPITFRADHPFIFFIIHNPTKTILFMGRVVNPALTS